MFIEKEYKTLVNKEEFLRIKNEIGPLEEVIQENFYFDAKKSLHLRGYSTRIRVIDDKYLFTLKKNTKDGKDEHEFYIDSFNIKDPKIISLLESLNIYDDLYLLGSLKTHRYLYKDSYGSLCLDENHYNYITDYEIEYELFDFKNDKLDHFIDLLKKFNIVYKENKRSKIKRFIDSKRV